MCLRFEGGGIWGNRGLRYASSSNGLYRYPFSRARTHSFEAETTRFNGTCARKHRHSRLSGAPVSTEGNDLQHRFVVDESVPAEWSQRDR